MTYYVALFQQREFWRVFKTTDESLAERMYTQYRQDTVDYAAADLERIKLQAEVAKAEKQLNESADQLTVLQNDLALQRQQEALAIAQREESRREAQALAEQSVKPESSCPGCAGFLVVVLDRTTWGHDLVRTHGGIAHDNDAPVLVVLAQQIPGFQSFALAA
uniref:Uncharacterized protein n=1 Tax=Panagrolaimus superbus TaxID=310955 RepID=A0A914YUS1_9BILA